MGDVLPPLLSNRRKACEAVVQTDFFHSLGHSVTVWVLRPYGLPLSQLSAVEFDLRDMWVNNRLHKYSTPSSFIVVWWLPQQWCCGYTHTGHEFLKQKNFPPSVTMGDVLPHLWSNRRKACEAVVQTPTALSYDFFSHFYMAWLAPLQHAQARLKLWYQPNEHLIIPASAQP